MEFSTTSFAAAPSSSPTDARSQVLKHFEGIAKPIVATVAKNIIPKINDAQKGIKFMGKVLRIPGNVRSHFLKHLRRSPTSSNEEEESRLLNIYIAQLQAQVDEVVYKIGITFQKNEHCEELMTCVHELTSSVENALKGYLKEQNRTDPQIPYQNTGTSTAESDIPANMPSTSRVSAPRAAVPSQDPPIPSTSEWDTSLSPYERLLMGLPLCPPFLSTSVETTTSTSEPTSSQSKPLAMENQVPSVPQTTPTLISSTSASTVSSTPAKTPAKRGRPKKRQNDENYDIHREVNKKKKTADATALSQTIGERIKMRPRRCSPSGHAAAHSTRSSPRKIAIKGKKKSAAQTLESWKALPIIVRIPFTKARPTTSNPSEKEANNPTEESQPSNSSYSTIRSTPSPIAGTSASFVPSDESVIQMSDFAMVDQDFVSEAFRRQGFKNGTHGLVPKPLGPGVPPRQNPQKM